MKNQFFGVVLAMFIAVFVSCTNNQGSKDDENEITYYFWEEPTIERVIETFNSSQDEITVIPKPLPINDYELKILNLLSAQEDVDAFAQKTQVQMPSHYESGFIADLEDIEAAKDFDFSAYKTYKTSITVNGRYVGMPFRGANRYIYFNKVLFDKAEEPYPTTYSDAGTWTWEKFEEVATRISEKLDGVYGINFHTWPQFSMSESFQNEASFIDSDGNVTIDSDRDVILRDFTRRKKLEEAGVMWPMQDLKVTKMHYSTAFFGGNVAMLQIGEWFPGMLLGAKEKELFTGFTWNDWGVAPIPNDRNVRVNPGIPTYAHVAKFSSKKDAAFRFLRWLAGPEGAAELAKAGYLPTIITDEVQENLKPNFADTKSLEVFLEPFDRLSPILTPNYAAGIDQVMGATFEEFLSKDMSEDDIFESFRKRLEQVVREN